MKRKSKVDVCIDIFGNLPILGKPIISHLALVGTERYVTSLKQRYETMSESSKYLKSLMEIKDSVQCERFVRRKEEVLRREFYDADKSH